FPWVEARFTLRQYAAGVLQGQTQPAAGYGGTVLSWSRPELPVLPTRGLRPQLRDTATGALTDPVQDGTARLYVCGITPYDSTHLGHAFTYVAFDTLYRAWRDAGLDVTYVQNVTDIDDPLLERAAETGVDWRGRAGDPVDWGRRGRPAVRGVARGPCERGA